MKVKSIKAESVQGYKGQTRFTIKYETGKAKTQHETTFVYDNLTGRAHFPEEERFRYELEEVAEAWVTLSYYHFWKEV